MSEILSHQKLSLLIERVPLQTAQAVAKQAKEQVDILIGHANQHAEEKLPAIIAEAREKMQDLQHVELVRLKALAEVNALSAENNLLDAKAAYVRVIGGNVPEHLSYPVEADANHEPGTLQEAYEIAIPSLKEQQKIVDTIKAAIPKIDKAQELTNQNLEYLKSLKSSLLDQAFKGAL